MAVKFDVIDQDVNKTQIQRHLSELYENNNALLLRLFLM